MPTHVALLRGINVGGKNKLPMKELVAIFAGAGCADVRSYIQSGNVVFHASEKLAPCLPALVATAIAERFGWRVPVVMRTADELREVSEHNPFLAAGPVARTRVTRPAIGPRAWEVPGSATGPRAWEVPGSATGPRAWEVPGSATGPRAWDIGATGTLDPATLHVMFLADQPSRTRAATLDPERSPGDAFALRGRDIYFRLSTGVARTRLTNDYFDTKLGTVSTGRNWNTVLRLLELAEE